MSFKIGDLVIGAKSASDRYNHTKEGCLVVVEREPDGDGIFLGRMIKHPNGNKYYHSGRPWPLDVKHFFPESLEENE